MKFNKNVIFVKLLRDQKTNNSKGRAFIKFMTYNDALSIINEGDINMNGRKLRISMVNKDNKKKPEKNFQQEKENPKFFQGKNFNNENFIQLNKKENYENNQSNTIYVKNLPENLEENKLKKLFKKFGNISSIRLMKRADNSVKNFCYVDFENFESVDEVIKFSTSNTGCLKIGDKELIVEKAKSSFNQNVFNDSKTLAKKRKREDREKELKKIEKEKNINDEEEQE